MRDNFLIKLELPKSARLAVTKAQFLTLSPCLGVGLQPYNPLPKYKCAGYPNSNPYTCRASTFTLMNTPTQT